MQTGIFSEFTRQSPDMIIKKSKNFKQVNFLKSAEQSEKMLGSDWSNSGSSSHSVSMMFDQVMSGKNTAATITANP